MKIHDISRELFSAPVYEGDPEPRLCRLKAFDKGDGLNLSALYCCLHASTHVDAPFHFVDGGDTVDMLPLELFFGKCTVMSFEGAVTGADIDRRVKEGCVRLLIKGGGAAFLTQSAAFALADVGVRLVGTDAQSVAMPEDTEVVHRELLTNRLAILEGLDLSGVAEGDYFLAAAPVKIAGVDGALCRAVLLEDIFEL